MSATTSTDATLSQTSSNDAVTIQSLPADLTLRFHSAWQFQAVADVLRSARLAITDVLDALDLESFSAGEEILELDAKLMQTIFEVRSLTVLADKMAQTGGLQFVEACENAEDWRVVEKEMLGNEDK